MTNCREVQKSKAPFILHKRTRPVSNSFRDKSYNLGLPPPPTKETRLKDQFLFATYFVNIVMIFTHNNPYLWGQTTCMSLWFYSVESNQFCW